MGYQGQRAPVPETRLLWADCGGDINLPTWQPSAESMAGRYGSALAFPGAVAQGYGY
jgi:hypothetical protein